MNELERLARALYEAEDARDRAADPGSATLGPWNEFPEHWKQGYISDVCTLLGAMKKPGDEAVKVAMHYLRTDCDTNFEMALDAMIDSIIQEHEASK